jgi:hypothetical protein
VGIIHGFNAAHMRLNQNIEHAEQDIRSYTKFRNEKFLQMLQKNLGEAWLKKTMASGDS